MKKTIQIEGMSCAHCTKAVEKALRAVPGVVDAKVDLAQKNATVELDGDIANSLLSEAVSDAGYEVTNIQ